MPRTSRAKYDCILCNVFSLYFFSISLFVSFFFLFSLIFMRNVWSETIENVCLNKSYSSRFPFNALLMFIHLRIDIVSPSSSSSFFFFPIILVSVASVFVLYFVSICTFSEEKTWIVHVSASMWTQQHRIRIESNSSIRTASCTRHELNVEQNVLLKQTRTQKTKN